jgi:hypothetical protein
MKSNKAFFNGEARTYEKMAEHYEKEALRWVQQGNAEAATQCSEAAEVARISAAEMRRKAKRS